MYICYCVGCPCSLIHLFTHRWHHFSCSPIPLIKVYRHTELQTYIHTDIQIHRHPDIQTTHIANSMNPAVGIQLAKNLPYLALGWNPKRSGFCRSSSKVGPSRPSGSSGGIKMSPTKVYMRSLKRIRTFLT